MFRVPATHRAGSADIPRSHVEPLYWDDSEQRWIGIFYREFSQLLNMDALAASVATESGLDKWPRHRIPFGVHLAKLGLDLQYCVIHNRFGARARVRVSADAPNDGSRGFQELQTAFQEPDYYVNDPEVAESRAATNTGVLSSIWNNIVFDVPLLIASTGRDIIMRMEYLSERGAADGSGGQVSIATRWAYVP